MDKLFVTGIPVTGKDLIGREREKREIKELIKGGQSVILYGPRRCGKTSLALTVLQEFQSLDYYTGSVDIFSTPELSILAEQICDATLSNRKISRLINEVKESISSVVKKMEFKNVIEEFEFILKFGERRVNEMNLLTNALDFPNDFADKFNKTMVFFYDEISDIVKLDGEKIVKLMRSKFQLHDNAVYIFAGSYQSVMKDIFINDKGPFYRFGKLIYIGNLKQKPLKEYIHAKYAQKGIEVDDKIIEQILNKTNCHPYYTQLLCRELYFAMLDESRQVRQSDVDEAFEEAMRTENDYFDILWARISNFSSQKKVLGYIAFDRDDLFALEKKKNINVARTLQLLINNGFIRKVEKGWYEFIDPLFKVYVKSKFS